MIAERISRTKGNYQIFSAVQIHQYTFLELADVVDDVGSSVLVMTAGRFTEPSSGEISDSPILRGKN